MIILNYQFTCFLINKKMATSTVIAFCENNKLLTRKISTDDYLKFRIMSPDKQKIFFKRRFSFGSKSSKSNKIPKQNKKNEQTKVCASKGLLTSDAVTELRKLVNDDSKEYKEFGGGLKFILRQGIFYFQPVKSSYIKGDKNGTNVPEFKANFHTHPSQEYLAQAVSAAWPSGDDYKAITEKINEEQMAIHIVATKEGIYIISLSREMCLNPGGVKKIKSKDTNKYKFSLPDIDKKGDTPRDYIRKVNKIKPAIFKVSFRSWNTSVKKPFLFYFPTELNKNCKL